MSQREPNIENVLKVLRGEKADRPTMFEFALNADCLVYGAGGHKEEANDPENLAWWKTVIRGFAGLGYDFVPMHATDVRFRDAHDRKESVSLNEGGVIDDWESFERYEWPDFTTLDYSRLDTLTPFLQDGQKIMPFAPGGVLENVINLVGFEDLCYLFVDEEELVQELFNRVGERLVTYYENIASHPSVGFCLMNDDWGFKTSTMISTNQLKEFVFPWHKKVVETIHAANKPAILHSCGNLIEVFDDIIDELGYDGKHSYEDAIVPVEDAFDRWGDRISIVGGIDVDYIIRKDTEDVYKRSLEMLERTSNTGRYLLGSGNSIPGYVPFEQYLAMRQAVLDFSY